MKAKFESSVDKNRNKLADVLPLKSPYTIYIEPTRLCNLKCYYCMHSSRNVPNGELEKTGYVLKNMDMLMYEKLVSDINNFNPQPKRIVFSGLGEPLMNKKLPEMIKLLRNTGYMNRIDIITNAVLLSYDVSDKLVEAGVSRIQISIQGLDDIQYFKNCGVEVNFKKLVDNIRYFYEHKKQSEIYIKIIDDELKTVEDKERFFDIFGDICDSIFIEHLIVLEQQMGDHGGKVDSSLNINNEKITFSNCCTVPTYHLQIGVDGDVFPCPIVGLPRSFAIGSIVFNNLSEIWKGEKRKNLILQMLKGDKNNIPVCGSCLSHCTIQGDEENLEPYADELIRKYE